MTSKLMLFEKQDVLGFLTDFYRNDEGNLYMTGEQIGRCLEYANPVQSISNLYKKYEDNLNGYSVLTKLMSTDGKRYKTRVFNEQGIYLIAMKSNQPKAWEFAKAVAKILENLRKGYQVWLLERERGKEARRSLTDTIRDGYPDSPHKRFMYKNFTELVYKYITGKSSKELKEEYGEPLRDKLPAEVLKKVKAIESIVKGYVELGYDYKRVKSLIAPQLED